MGPDHRPQQRGGGRWCQGRRLKFQVLKRWSVSAEIERGKHVAGPILSRGEHRELPICGEEFENRSVLHDLVIDFAPLRKGRNDDHRYPKSQSPGVDLRRWYVVVITA